MGSPHWVAMLSSKLCHLFLESSGKLDQLSKLHMSGVGNCISDLAPLFKLPSLETLVAMGYREAPDYITDDWDIDLFGIAHKSSIKVLELYGYEICSGTLPLLIKSCKALNAFALDYSVYERRRGSEHNLDAKRGILNIRRALSSCQETLRSLSIQETNIAVHASRWTPLGPLSAYTTQEHLRVDSEVLYNTPNGKWEDPSELLPVSLKTLDLRSYECEHPYALKIFISILSWVTRSRKSHLRFRICSSSRLHVWLPTYYVHHCFKWAWKS
jgi:hypothetical protein